jgi:hypothetical protein
LNIRIERALPILALVLAGAVTCRREIPRRTTWTFLGPAELVSAYEGDQAAKSEVALHHVLFVFDVDPAERSSGISGGGGGGGTGGDFQYHCSYQDSRVSIRSQPVSIRNRKTVTGGGRTFDLARGNVFVALVSRDGTPQLSQLPNVPGSPDAEPDAVLAFIKTSLPANPRIQALHSSR